MTNKWKLHFASKLIHFDPQTSVAIYNDPFFGHFNLFLYSNYTFFLLYQLKILYSNYLGILATSSQNEI